MVVTTLGGGVCVTDPTKQRGWCALLARVLGSVVRSGQTRVLLAALTGALVSLALVAQGAWGVPQQQVDQDPQGAPYVVGELLVVYEPGIKTAAASELPKETGGQVEEEIPEIETQLLTFPEVKRETSKNRREDLLQQKEEELQRDPAVESVSFNYIVRAAFIPNDTKFEQQWGMRKIRFPRAWGEVRGNGIDIAVVDTGIDNNHPDLQGKVAEQRNFVTDAETNRAEDGNGHGTHVSGIAAAVTDNRTGVAGACPQCRLIVAKSLNDFNTGTVEDVAKGIVWAADNGAEVINLSLGLEVDSETLDDAVAYATGKDAVVVAAAGNLAQKGNPTVYPAAYENTIAVAATTIENRRAGYSSFGDYVDVAAPGGDDEGSQGEMILSNYLGGGYEYLVGTSMASPHVAGLAGLLAAQGRSRTEIRNRIERTARDLGPDGRDNLYGHGLVNAAAAVGVRTQPPPPPPNTAPRISNPRPAPGSTTKARRPVVTATLRDVETNLRKSNLTLVFDGRKKGVFSYDTGRERLSYRPAGKLSPGRHSVRIVVRDGQRLKDNKKWNFKVKVKRRSPGNDGSGSGGPFATVNAPDFPFNVLPDNPIFDIVRN